MTSTKLEQHARATAPVVVGVDGSEASKIALRWAINYAKTAGTHVRAVIAWRWPMSLLVALPIVEVSDPADEAPKTLEETVAKVLGDDPSPVKIETTARYGDAAPVLLEQAARSSLLVIGGRRSVGHHAPPLGYTSEQCVRHAACPVAVIRPYHVDDAAAGQTPGQRTRESAAR